MSGIQVCLIDTVLFNICSYVSLGVGERKRLELEEDRILCTLLFNLVAFMVMMQVTGSAAIPQPPTSTHSHIPGGLDEGRKKIRRLLARCHIGLQYSQEFDGLLSSLDKLVLHCTLHSGYSLLHLMAYSAVSINQTLQVHCTCTLLVQVVNAD